MNLEIYLKKMFDDKTNAVPILAYTKSPPAVNTPIAATHQRVAAVFNPFTLLPSLNITPAPKKPIPQTTCDATRVLSSESGNTAKDKYTNKNAPIPTKTLVLRPIILCRYCLSIPINILKIKQKAILTIKTLVSIFILHHPFNIYSII